MPLFYTPGEAAEAAGMGSGVGPDLTDWYAVTGVGVEAATGGNFKAGSYYLNLNYEDGSTGHEIISVGYDESGNVIAGIDEKKAQGRTKFINGILRSFGYTAEDLKSGWTDEFFMGRTGYVEWHAATDLGAEYGKVARWLTKDAYDALKASGRKPVVAAGKPQKQAAAQGTNGAGSATGATKPARTLPRPPAPPAR